MWSPFMVKEGVDGYKIISTAKTYRISVIMCSVISVFIYIYSFYGSSKYGLGVNDTTGPYYTFRLIYWMAFCVLGSMLYRSKRRKSSVLVAGIIALLAYSVIIEEVFHRNSLYAIKEVCLSLWPIVTYVLATGLVKWNGNKSKPQYMLGMGAYFVILQMMMFVIENTLVPSEFFRRDSIEITFMFVVGAVSWVVAEKQYRMAHSTAAFGVCCIFSVLAMFWNHKRILDIVRSLSNPVVSGSTGQLSRENWVGYRLGLALDAWTGDISSYMQEPFYVNVDNCLLFWVKDQLGWLAFVIAVAAGLILLYSLVKLTRGSGAENNSFRKFLVISLVLRCALGYFAELFLIVSTDLGALLLRNPGEVLLIGLLIFLNLEEGNMKEEAGKKVDNMDAAGKRYSNVHGSGSKQVIQKIEGETMRTEWDRATLLERCRSGDSQAMLEMSKCCDTEFANMWLVRAVLYGNEEARELLRCNPQRASNTFLPIENFIPGKRTSWFNGKYHAVSLSEIGFDNLPSMDETYMLAGLSRERVIVLGMETGYEPPDEDGFGAETYYSYYVYDEFFHRISPKAFEDNPHAAYGVGNEYIKAHGDLPKLRMDWLVEDGILKAERFST